MAASATQVALARAFDRALHGHLGADFDTFVDLAASTLNTNGLAAGQRDAAVVRYALHLGYMQNPAVLAQGAQTSSSDTPGTSRGSSQSHLPMGFDPTWYQTGHGRALIGLFFSSSACAPT